MSDTAQVINQHSKITDIKLFRFMLRLADGADSQGVIDPAPTYEAMAEQEGVSTRTIQAWLNKLADYGELEQTRIGSGPGRPSAYRILLPFPVKVEANPAIPSTFTQKVEAKVEAKVEEIPAKVEAMDMMDFYLLLSDLKQELKGLAQKVEAIDWFASTFTQKVEAKVEAKVEEIPAKVEILLPFNGKGGSNGHVALPPFSAPIITLTNTKNKEEEVREEEETTPTSPVDSLAEYFTSLTAIFPKNGAYVEEWEMPLSLLVKNSGSVTAAKDKLRRAWEFSRKPTGRDRAFTIKSPLSLSTIIANLPSEEIPANTVRVSAR